MAARPGLGTGWRTTPTQTKTRTVSALLVLRGKDAARYRPARRRERRRQFIGGGTFYEDEKKLATIN
jgi:hypothetical protein